MKKDFIEFMVRSGVLTFGDFITKSGRQTPYFINTGNYKTASQISKLGQFYATLLNEKFKTEKFTLFGPAYKGIPLVVTTAVALNNKYNLDPLYCFNRKELKDHGEGGNLIGAKLHDGDNIIIIEDVITAGTAIRECLPILQSSANVNIKALIISVDRMEKGQSNLTAIEEIKQEFGIDTYPIVTVKDIIETLHNNPVDGQIIIDDTLKNKMEIYLDKYCIK
ncbi:orotate phosphoribosyltransferase [Candidatus Epulonipiscioides saccharophilum]|nr:orotate phosphoribosyltransferase [Epulopiscium sp. SCG-B10WGA-EpuloB]ONI47686.1 orotate phosphoribosyltransferase [Epulopiscium sp. SCG-B10WGA-EpuloB]